ncbi:phycobiliprotein lyase [Halomicronema hongdechloris C2206]|uniref:Chromophore lyase CpcS/CpeS n=1 Tax=Halomicronema hongdechloris C2206 TaxID=1641165 RepID=A0A1Z3HKL3_9CYAN|nr:phycobiliprotein lyase [Halomicronema hongdechloris]ASC70849.1 phycobiliprotein lyase [Halomicronema hongdechloris C2206]
MPFSVDTARLLAEPLITAFFQASAGRWLSERRYYTLPDGKVQEVVSHIAIRFLQAGSAELLHLADLHQLQQQDALICGAEVAWESNYPNTSRKPVKGSTVFGVRGTLLYRDRGFATSKPVTAQFLFRDPKTLQLRTEYNDSVFEEELKLVGRQYRTRQTIISRAGQQQMIGQYLERRC